MCDAVRIRFRSNCYTIYECADDETCTGNYYITPPEPAYASISTEATPASDPTVDPDLVAAQSTVTALPTPTALLARLARSAQIASITLLPVLIAAGVQTVPVSYWCEIPAPHRGLMGRQIPVPKPVPRECGRCIANGASEAGGWMVWAVFGGFARSHYFSVLEDREPNLT